MPMGHAALNRLFETWGTDASNMANQTLLAASHSDALTTALRYFTPRRRDLLRPTLIRLACQAVQGNPDHTTPAAVAMILTSYHLGLIDDVIDQSHVKLFRPTLLQQVGVTQSLLVATLCLTQAHHVLYRLQDHVDGATYHRVHEVFTAFPITMIEGEEHNIAVKREGIVPPTQLLQVLTQHAADIAACTEVGALIGGASATTVALFREYGQRLGQLLLLNDENRDALNFSLNLDAKLLTKAYPYPVLWAAHHSAPFRRFLKTVQERSVLTPEEIATCVQTLETTGAIMHVKTLMTQYAQEAASTLTALPETDARDHLVELVLAQPDLVLP